MRKCVISLDNDYQRGQSYDREREELWDSGEKDIDTLVFISFLVV